MILSMTMAALSCAVIFMVVHLAAAGLYLRRLRKARVTVAPRDAGIGRPFVTLLRPVCRVDPFDSLTLRSSFRQDYPNYEVVFCAQSPDDPVVGLVRRLMAEHPEVPSRLLIGHDGVTGNPKLNNVWKGWHAAGAEWVCMTDSNLMLPRNYLSTVVASWRDGCGLVSSPPVGIMAQNPWGHLECAFLNGNQAVLQYAIASLGFGFAQGKTMFFNKPMLESAGGLRQLGATLAEDAAATRLIRRLGRTVTLTPLPFGQPIGRRSLAQVWGRQLRWSRVRRDAFPLLFMCEILNGGMLPLASVTAAAVLSGTSLAIVPVYGALWYLAEIVVTKRAGWPMGRSHIALLLLRDAMMPLIWGATYLRRGFEWRGTTLTPGPAAEAATAG